MLEKNSRYWVSIQQAMTLLNLGSEKSCYRLISKGKLDSRLRFGKRYVWSPEIQRMYLAVAGNSSGKEKMKGLSEGEVDLLWEPVPREAGIPSSRLKPSTSPLGERKARRSFQGLTGEELDHLLTGEQEQSFPNQSEQLQPDRTGLRDEIDDELLKLETKISHLSKIVEDVDEKKKDNQISFFEKNLSGQIHALSKALKQRGSEIRNLNTKLRKTSNKLNNLRNSIESLQNEKPTRVEAVVIPPGREGGDVSEKFRPSRPLQQREAIAAVHLKQKVKEEADASFEPLLCVPSLKDREAHRDRKKRSPFRLLLAAGSIILLASITGILILSLINV